MSFWNNHKKPKNGELKKLMELDRKRREDSIAEFVGRQGMAFTAAKMLSEMTLEEERDEWEENDFLIDKDDYESEEDYMDAVNAEKQLNWIDNDFGIDKADFEDEYEYMDEVRSYWPDNDVDVYKEDYDTLEEYLDAMKDEGEDVD